MEDLPLPPFGPTGPTGPTGMSIPRFSQSYNGDEDWGDPAPLGQPLGAMIAMAFFMLAMLLGIAIATYQLFG